MTYDVFGGTLNLTQPQCINKYPDDKHTGLELRDYIIIKPDAVRRCRVDVHPIQIRQLLVQVSQLCR